MTVIRAKVKNKKVEKGNRKYRGACVLDRVAMQNLTEKVIFEDLKE